MTTTAIGQLAEQAASEYLVRNGYEIITRNWRNRLCEIDIVALKDGCVHFVEVKYRQADTYGSGLEYITKSKQKQMKFAAEQWTFENRWAGEVNLAAIEVCAPDYAIGTFIDSVF
jgi:putative endonuclease